MRVWGTGGSVIKSIHTALVGNWSLGPHACETAHNCLLPPPRLSKSWWWLWLLKRTYIPRNGTVVCSKQVAQESSQLQIRLREHRFIANCSSICNTNIQLVSMADLKELGELILRSLPPLWSAGRLFQWGACDDQESTRSSGRLRRCSVCGKC